MNKGQLIRIGKYTLKPTIAVLICLGFVYVFAGKISAVSNLMNSRNTNRAILDRQIETAGHLQSDFAALGDKNYNAVINAFPTTDNVVEIGVALDKLATANSITMTRTFGSNLVPTGLDIKEPGNGLSTIDVSMILTGTKSQFVRFLKSLAKFQYFFSTGNVTISASSPQGWDGPSNINLHGKIYLKQANG